MVPSFNPNRAAYVRPIDILHGIGVATNPILPGAAELSRRWALARYIWAFTPGKPHEPLRLSPEVRQIDRHRKAVLSDDMGVGFAYWIMEGFFEAPNCIDVLVALGQKSWPIRLTMARSPDYLFFDDPSAVTFVVEAKGNQSSVQASYDQISSGTGQIPSVQFTDGRSSVGLIMSTNLGNRTTTTFVVDPPEDGKNNGRLLRFQTSPSESIKWLRTLVRCKMLTFAGQYDGAVRSMREFLEWEPRIPAPKTVTVETGFGLFRGIEWSIVLDDGSTMSVYQGLLSQLVEHYLEGDDEAARTVLERYRAYLADQILKLGEDRSDGDGALSFSRVGTLLKIGLR